MKHVFDAKQMSKLDDPRRKDLIPIEKVFSILEIKAGETLLDLGCGIGYLTLPAVKSVGEDGFVYGLDIQEAMLLEAEARSKKEELANIAWVITPPDKIDLPDDCADCVTLGMVAHEVPDLVNLLKECHRVLVQGGRIGVIEWNETFTEMGPPLDHRLKQSVLVDELKKQGFERIEQVELSPATYLVKANAR